MIKLNAYQLKLIAIIGMTLNHIVFALWDIFPAWLRFPLYCAGGLTFPIMGYLIVEGYKHTSNLKRYMLRVLLFGLIATPFHMLSIGLPGLNIMFTILLCLIILYLNDKIKIRPLFWLIFAILVPISIMFFEWYFVGTTMVLMYHLIKNEKVRRVLPPILAGLCWLAISMFGVVSIKSVLGTPGSEAFLEDFYNTFGDLNFMWVNSTFMIGCFIAAFLLSRYNGERGKRMKWLFYIYYPVHLAVLAIIALALGLTDFGIFGY